MSNKKEIVFKILGLATSVAFGLISLIGEIKYRKNKIVQLSEEDKNDIADKVITKLNNSIESVVLK